MSADRPHRGSSRQHRSTSPLDFMSVFLGLTDRPSPSDSPYTWPAPGTPSPLGMPSGPARSSTQTRHDQPAEQAPPYAAISLHRPAHPSQGTHSLSADGPALAALSASHSSATPHPPLPPLRSLNRGTLPHPGSLTHTLSQSRHPYPQPLSLHPLPTSAPTDSSLPFGYRFSRRRSSNLASAISSLDEIDHSLEDANSHLRALLDTPSQPDVLNQIPASPHHAMFPRPAGGIGSRREPSRSDESGRLSKRRKLDSERAGTPAYKGFRYGRYGQVEPGDLTMEIVSCDGGMYSDGTSYAAENILKNDNSVYCTKGDRCNIVLQHQGRTTFSLKELVIRAPGRNYSSPVGEGMVFLSMSRDELVNTDQYHSHWAVPPASSIYPRTDSLWRRATQRARSRHPASDVHGHNEHNEDVDDPYADIYNPAVNLSDDTPSAAPDELDLATNPPTYYVMTECSDDEVDEAAGEGARERDARGPGWRGAAGWSPTPLRNRIRRRLPAYEEESPFGAHLITWDVENNFEADDDDDTELHDLGDATISSPESPADDGEARRTARARADRDYARAHSNGVYGQDPDEGLWATYYGSPLLASRNRGQYEPEGQQTLPNAQFHIEKNKNKCTIHFNPPVTARYILLKMWNPCQNSAGNIDIQGVVAKGFAGPRYFPSLELR